MHYTQLPHQYPISVIIKHPIQSAHPPNHNTEEHQSQHASSNRPTSGLHHDPAVASPNKSTIETPHRPHESALSTRVLPSKIIRDACQQHAASAVINDDTADARFSRFQSHSVLWIPRLHRIAFDVSYVDVNNG